jgi:aerobic carbon-monoxide dehydrogenase large subunit
MSAVASGPRAGNNVEHRLTLWAAKKLGRPVKWSCERSEVILADEHGRDNLGEIELAFDDNAKIVGLRLHMLANVGAYCVGSAAPAPLRHDRHGGWCL